MWTAGVKVVALNMLDDSDQGGVDPADVGGGAYVVNNWATQTDGHVVVNMTRAWYDLGLLRAGMVVAVNGGDGEGVPAGSFASFVGRLVRYDGSDWHLYASNASALDVVSDVDTYYKGQRWTWDAEGGWKRAAEFPLAGTEGDFVSVGADGMPEGSGSSASTFAAATHASGHLATGADPMEHWVSIYVPISDMIDGATPPAAIETITDGAAKIVVRKFAGAAANEDVQFTVEVPYNWSSGLSYRVVGWITEATVPAADEGLGFLMSAANIGTSERLSKALGATQASSIPDLLDLFVNTTYDRFITEQSGLVAVANMAVGATIMLKLERDYDYGGADAYEQDVGVSGVLLYFKVTSKDTPIPA